VKEGAGFAPGQFFALRDRRFNVSRRSSHALTTTPAPPPARAEPAEPNVPPASAGRQRQRLGVLALATAVLVGAAAWVAWVAWDAPREIGSAQRDDLLLCWRFAALKNAHEPAADKLLALPARATEDPVTPEQAELLDADAFLRRDLRVVDVRPDRSAKDAGRFVLVTRGAAAGEALRVRSGDKVERTQRVMTNPEVVVEVRDGKIDGVRVQLGMD
jgi:hypothetical protein